MKKMVAIQVALLVVFAGGFFGMLATTDIYEEIHDNIVSVLCLSCLKLDSKTSFSYIETTANGEDIPAFLLTNLTTGPIFLHYSQDVCHGCEIMLPVVQEFLDLSYEKQDTISTKLTIKGQELTYYYINNDHAPDALATTFALFDTTGIGARPMFVLLTLDINADGDTIVTYASQSGVLGEDDYESQYAYTQTIVEEAISMWQSASEGYIYP